MIHVDVWQKPKQFCKAFILQLKNKQIFKKSMAVSFQCMTKFTTNNKKKTFKKRETWINRQVWPWDYKMKQSKG